MKTERPKVKRVYATFRDADTGVSESFTIYESTTSEVAQYLLRRAEADGKKVKQMKRSRARKKAA